VASFKSLARQALSIPVVGRLLSRYLHRRATVLCLHRFRDGRWSDAGHDLDLLEATIVQLRAAGVEFLAVDDLAERALHDPPSKTRASAVAFTVDDGYADFEAAARVFVRQKCPCTVFIVPAAVDGLTWFWWDRLEWLLTSSELASGTIAVGDEMVSVGTNESGSLGSALVSLCERLKLIPRQELETFLSRLADELQLTIPESAPARYSVMSWDTLRALESEWVQVGAHSWSHPVLSRCTDADVEHEIHASYSRVQRELRRPSRLFCYPNGRPIDAGLREHRLVESAAALGALSTSPGHLTPESVVQSGPGLRWRLPRFPYVDVTGAAARIVYGSRTLFPPSDEQFAGP
jgi:peptidoglycan/xylan/chitin deacetylase (PgdA/CDA1 family)